MNMLVVSRASALVKTKLVINANLLPNAQHARCVHNPRYLRGVMPRPNPKNKVFHPLSKRARIIEEKRLASGFDALTSGRTLLAPMTPVNTIYRNKPQPQCWLYTMSPSALPSSSSSSPSSSSSSSSASSASSSSSSSSSELPPPRALVPIGLVPLNRTVFDADTERTDILHRIVTWQRACARAGTASTKTVAEVAGTGRKPHAQKGTGRARQGTLKGPHQRGGGVAHGPKPRSFAYNMPQQIRRLAMRIALSTKFKEGAIKILDEAKLEPEIDDSRPSWLSSLPSSSTSLSSRPHHVNYSSTMADILLGAKLKNVLIIHGNQELDGNLALAARGLRMLNLLPSRGANVLMVLRASNILISKQALSELELRLTSRRNKIEWNVGSDGVSRPIRFTARQTRAYGRRGPLVKAALLERSLRTKHIPVTFSPTPEAAQPKIQLD